MDIATDESDDSDNDTGKDSEYDNYGCEKCGRRLATLRELAAHKDTHKIHQCVRCRQRFTSNYLANKHELTCTTQVEEDVFEASRSSDPLMVVINNLGQLVNTFNRCGAMKDDVTGLIRDQLRKAKHNHASSKTAKRNHQIQRTWTFLKPPTFTPSNLVTHYSDKDVEELRGKEFSGNGTAEENFTSLQILTTAIGRIVKSKRITKNVATELLIQNMKAPALDLTSQFRERFEQKHEDNAVPEYEDILILLEEYFINIKPQHAREQLDAMSKGDSESITDFFNRAWRCSHFASFTEEEQNRYKFRNDTVKAAVMRNLGPAKRRLVEDKELERKMEGDEPMEPHEIVALVRRHQSRTESKESNRSRMDFSVMGELLPADIRRIENGPMVYHGEEPGEEQTEKGQELGEEEKAYHDEEGTHQWITNAAREVGDGCFKCGRRGHRARHCFTYTALAEQLCNLCSEGFHTEQECITGQGQRWDSQSRQDPMEEGSPRKGKWQEPNSKEQWPLQGAFQSYKQSHGPAKGRQKRHTNRGPTRNQEARRGPGYSPWDQPARGRNNRGGRHRVRTSNLITYRDEEQDQADMD